MFNKLKTKKRLTQALVAFVVICMSVTGSFLLLDDFVDSATAATTNVNVGDNASWTSAMNNSSSGDTINVTLTGDLTGAKLTAIKSGVTVNLNMNGKSIYWDNVASGTNAIMTNNSTPADTYWGLITNNGTLNITGTGTIRMKQVNYNYAKTTSGDYTAKACAIVNAGNLTISSGINVVNQLAMAANDAKTGTDGDGGYWDMFMYSCAIYNSGGTVTTSGNITSECFTGNTSHSGTNSYHYAFSYGIYQGTVITKGGSITSNALSGSLMATSSCAEENQVVAIAVGVFSNTGKYVGDTTINTKTTTWDSPGGYDAWSGGDDISFSAGIMYTGSNYPLIGASVDVNAYFECPGENELKVNIPGAFDSNGEPLYYTIKNKTAPGEYARRAYPLVGVDQNINTIGDHSGEVPWNSGTGFFGSGPDTTTGLVNQYFNFYDNMYYFPEDTYYDGLKTNAYREDASSLYQKESGSNSDEVVHKQIVNGIPGSAGTQYVIVYRYYEGSVAPANLVDASFSYDTTKQVSRAYLSIAGTTTNNNGSINDATATIAFGGGGVPKNSRYHELASTTIEKVATATYANRTVDYNTFKIQDLTQWSATGTPLTSAGTTMTTANTLVVYMNYVIKDPSAIRVVANNKGSTIDQYTDSTSFSATYTGASLVPGTDFNLGIIDMGVHISVDTNDTTDDTVVTSVYNISGTGSGSGNDATAVTYKYSADQSTWNNGLPKDVGTYWIEVNVNADTTFASTKTYNRQGATAYLTCTITKSNLTIEGPTSKTGTYGSTYGELVPFSEYKAVGLGSDQLEGSWSFASVGTNDYPKAQQTTVYLVWTPTAGTATANNYNATTFPVSLVVNKRAVNVNAGASFVTYGDAKPTYSIAYENLAACDESKKTEWFNTSEFEIFYNGAWTTYSAGVPAGEYTMRIKTFGGAADENNTFSINVAEGKFTVQKRSIVYNAVAVDRAYNGSATVDVKLNYVSGNYASDVYDAVINTTGTMTAGADAGEGKAVNIDKTAITIKNSSNYTLVVDNIDNITVNISKADPTGVAVVADPSTVTYDSTKTLATATSLHATATNIEGTWSWKAATTVPTVDVATYTAVFTPSNTTNYNVIEQQVTLTVEQKEVVVSVKKFNISYGDAVPAITGSITYTGFTGNDTVESISASGGTDTTTTYTRGSGIGTYPINVISTLTSTNYYFTSVDSDITVAPRALTITAKDQSVTYGANSPELDEADITATGFYGTDNLSSLGGTLSVSTVYVPGSPVDTYDIVASGYTSTNYAITFVNGTLTVNKATLTVTPNNVKGVTYGADAPAYKDNKLYTVTGFVAGDTYETVSITGDPAFTTGYASGKDAGSYPVTVNVNAMSSTNYNFVGAEGTLTVGQATPSVTEVPGAKVVNSHTFAEATFDGTETVVNPNKNGMTVEGTFAFADGTTVAVWGSDGMYDAVFTPDDTKNYTTTTVKVYLEITEKAISGKPIIQGSAMAGSTLTVSLTSMDPTLTQYYTYQWYADDSAISGATSTTYQVKDTDIGKTIKVYLVAKNEYGFTGNAWSDPTSAVIEALLETTAAQLNVVLPTDVEYDAMSHAAQVSIADGYNAQYFGSITIKYNGQTTVPVNAGTYVVTVDVGTPAMPDGGYPEDTYYGPATGISVGEFEITKAPYTVTVLASDKVYDGTTTAYATVTGSGLKDEMDDVRIAEGSKFAFADAKVGTDKEVKVTSMSLTGAQANNYEIKVTSATASITPATLKARVTGVTKVYDGSALVSVTFSNIEGYAAVDSASTVQIKNGSAIASSADAGTQNLTNITCTLEGSSAGNYTIEYINAATATVLINPATPNVEAPVISGLIYDSAKTLQTVDLSGYTTANGFWQFDDLTIVPTVTKKTYAATYYSNNKNYTNLNTEITLNVDPKAVVLTADDKSVAYGSKAPVFTITASGFTGDDTIADIGGSCTPVCTYAAGSDIGSYTINLNNALSDDNYTFTTQSGTLTVSPARLNVTASAANKVYDGSTAIKVSFAIVSGKYGNDDVALSATTVTGNTATANAGPTTVSYTAPTLVGAKADNYELYITPASGALNVEIAKADVAGVIFPVDGTVEFGYDLSYATFAIDGVGDGTFAYENAKSTVPGAIGLYTNYKVIFTPTDSRNYNSQEAYVSLEVVKCVLDYVVGVAGTPQQGETLAVVFTGMPAHANAYVQYQWYRVSSKDVEAIPDATGSKYVATEEDVGYTLVVVTYFDEHDPYVFSESANIETIDGDIEGIIGQTADAIEELALTFWQRLMNWIRRIIAAITGVTLQM